jgi:acetyltransferase-like isoleucine patch superfamily enzyme
MARVTDIHPSVAVHATARINVTERLVIGAGTVIGENVEISGRDVEIGRESWLDYGARIGGGSCFGRHSFFRAGDFLHMGQDAFINTARPVRIGDEVGLGTRTAIYTHGAYLSVLDGFPASFAPVHIGDRVWIPGATVNPGVTIGSDVVVGVNSLVTRDLPDGCLAAGSPAKVIREGAYPVPLSSADRDAFWVRFSNDYDFSLTTQDMSVILGETAFIPEVRAIIGPVTAETERFRDQCRRYGIRFYARPVDGQYEAWQ